MFHLAAILLFALPAPPEARLSGPLRSAAERFFATDLADVVIHTGPEAGRLGAAAYTSGNHIYLAHELHLPPAAWLALLGHELAHVVQQRQGRVPAIGLLNQQAFNDDAGLEREADELGRRFALGERPLPAPRYTQADPTPVLQRSVTVGGRLLQSHHDLSAEGAAVLSLINSGTPWMAWAIDSPTARYAFTSERELVLAVQMGLHAEPTLLLPALGLRVHPSRLMDLPLADLNTLRAWEADPGSAVVQAQGRRILAQNGWRTQADLAPVTQFLAQTGVGNAPVFQALSLSDQLALNGVLEATTDPALANEAAAFAVSRAQTPREFVDYYRFYLAPLNAGSDAAQRQARAEQSLDALSSISWGLLNGPTLPNASPEPAQLQAALENWLRAGNPLGFARLSLAAAQLAQCRTLEGLSGEPLLQAAQRYVSQIQGLLMQALPAAIASGQTGDESLYRYRSAAGAATVRVDAAGNLTLAAFEEQP